jgi:hypothetical protein
MLLVLAALVFGVVGTAMAENGTKLPWTGATRQSTRLMETGTVMPW